MRSLAPLLLLSGCAGATADAPSLLPRPIESRSDVEPQVVPAPVAPDAALDADIARHVAAIAASIQAFAATESSAESLAARAAKAPGGSDAWLEAQGALSDLGSARAATDAAVADLTALAITRSESGAPPYPALDAAIARASAEADRQDEVTARLSALLDR
ncbi:hypothetical protein [Sphingomonas sp.]|uniref:hypothetical protein n=1 Tax=Sphingomonas sp. TaxID=28214 RepID=UPI002C6DCF2B|nr:hypothetical protein [Sphingomonas sp.]HWK35804.1 hypothetical protein [Sphingomonas sp.]